MPHSAEEEGKSEMTTIYFVRHCQSDHSVHDDRTRPLTPKGQGDSKLVTEFLRDKRICAVLSSPYQRAMDTVRDFADAYGFSIETVEDFRERKVGNRWIEDFIAFVKRHWEDVDYREPEGKACGRYRPGMWQRCGRCWNSMRERPSLWAPTARPFPPSSIFISRGLALSSLRKL